jgi:hypothetical protein
MTARGSAFRRRQGVSFRPSSTTEFEEIWTAAEDLFRASPDSRYLGGVCAACRWAANHPHALSPLYREAVRATAALILREDVLATMT